MQPAFEVSAHIGKPLHDVYEAIADPAQLSGYFTNGGARGRLLGGTTVWWNFADFPGEFPVEVIDAVADTYIVLRWQSEQSSDGHTTVTLRFTPTDDGRTRIVIDERGWRDDDDGLLASYRNCMGWSQMLCALKAWAERGINLREGMYK